MRTSIIAVLAVAFVVGMLMFIGFSPRRFFERLDGRGEKQRADRLLESVRQGDTAATQAFLSKGPWVPLGRALDLAAERGDVPMIALLIESGANASGVDGANTPLYDAAWGAHADAVRFLLDHGARLDVKLESGLTLLEQLEKTGTAVPDEVKALLRRAAAK